MPAQKSSRLIVTSKHAQEKIMQAESPGSEGPDSKWFHLEAKIRFQQSQESLRRSRDLPGEASDLRKKHTHKLHI